MSFLLPFDGKLDPENRWVKLSEIIPWDDIEEKYAELFPANCGMPAKPLRMALGALIIKEKCGFSDRETVEQIKENPYLQYFIGLEEFKTEAPFDSSLMVHFRKRLGVDEIIDINEMICRAKAEDENKDINDDDNDHEPQSPDSENTTQETDDKQSNKGTLILDATCAPADIRYPTDLSLLNEARMKLEEIIDTLHKPLRGKRPKPRTYRKVARLEFLAVSKKRRPSKNQIRKAIGKQLGYIRRDLAAIEKLVEIVGLGALSKRQLRNLWVINELYRQQEIMYKTKEHSIEDRIVSISQPHVRPIVRGKAGADTEFGAKVAISLADGYSYIEKISWDNFNEGITLIESVERFKERFGYYPKVVLADKIYRNRDNLKYCKKHGIRLSGPRLGRPPKVQDPQIRRQEYEDAKARNAVEGEIGVGKRRYGLGLIMACLQKTSETVIALQFMVMNLERKVRSLFWQFFKFLFCEFYAESFA
ncbi:MAG TPA: IS5 family transposase [Fervidobacterium sp.]|nr:IS5 family transposase [Fervidobacterium sp.]